MRKALLVSLACILVALSGRVSAHPDGAPPIDHPLVVGFERFFAQGDAPDYLAAGGILLIKRFGCAACHEAPSGWAESLSPAMAAGPLEGLGRGLGYPALWLAIRNPPALRNGARMPEMFAHQARDPDLPGALASFLHFSAPAGQQEQVPWDPMAGRDGDVDAGREIYHRLGCSACHAPEVPEGRETPNVHSLSLAVAETRDAEAVARMLAGDARGSSWHPDFGLSNEEVRLLTIYLRMPGAQGVGINPALLAGEPDADLVDKGRRAFLEMGCVACHPRDGVPGDGNASLPAAAALLGLQADKGCIASEPREGLPFFGISDLQRAALAQAFARMAGDPGALGWTVDEAIDLSLAARNCYACHTWREKGGLEEARAVLIADPAVEIPPLELRTDDPRTAQCRFRIEERTRKPR